MLRFYLYLGLFFGCVLQAAEPPDEPAAKAETGAETATEQDQTLSASSPSREQLISAQIESQIRSGEVLKLGADQTLALYQINMAEKELGAVLLLHDQAANADWPQLIRPMRMGFAEKGWHTLSLQLPLVSRDSDKINSLNLIDPAIERVSAAVAALQEKGQTNIFIIGHGLGAAIAALYISQNPDAPISGNIAISLPGEDALKLAKIEDKKESEMAADMSTEKAGEEKMEEAKTATPNPATTEPAAEDPSNEQITLPEDKDLYGEIAQIKIPFLDIYAQHDYQDVIFDAGKRAQIMKLAEHPNYRQDTILGADHYFRNSQDQLLGRLRGWMQKQSEDIN